MSLSEKKFSANPEILCETENDGMLLFDPESGEVKILNETGAFVFNLLKEGRSGCEILQQMMTTYDECDASMAEADLTELISQLQKAGLIFEREQEANSEAKI